jgi:hypothetical protein
MPVMNRAPRHQPATPIRRAEADPAEAALKRVAEMIGRGADAARIQREAAALIASWSSLMEDNEMRERLTTLHDQLVEGVEVAEEQAEEVDTDKASGKAFARTLTAMCAARDAFGHAASAPLQ